MSAETNKPAPEKPAGKSGAVRQKVLFGLLGLLLVGLAYDYRVARPGVDGAYDKLTKLHEQTNMKSTESLNQEDVKAAIGFAPSRSFPDGDDLVEVYSWRSGLPIRTHDLFVAYHAQADASSEEGAEPATQMVFYRHAKYKYDKRTDVVPIAERRAIEIDPNAIPEEGPAGGDGGGGGGGDEPDDSDGGAAPGTSGSPGGGGPGGGFDPEQFFSEQDEDGNGVLTGDELSDRMKQSLSETDTDGDGGISKAEFMARVEARRASGGGRPGAGGGSRGRPEAESDEEADDASPTAEKPAEEASAEEAPEEEKPADE